MAIYKGNQKIDGGYPISTEISSSSTNNEVAGAKAVYDFYAQQKNIIFLATTSDWNPSSNTTYQTISLEQNYMLGNKFTFNSSTHLVTVGEGVKAVKVSGQVSVNSSPTAGRKYIRITKNSGSPILNMSYMSSSDVRYLAIEYVFTVEDGDTIGMQYYGNLGDNLASGRAFLIIEAIDIDNSGGNSALSLNLSRGENTGSLVGMGDRAEITPLETTKDKTEGSGDIL